MKHRREEEGEGLSGTSSGNTNHVESRKTDRKTDRLDCRWLGKLAPFDAFQNVAGEVALLKFEDRAGALNLEG